MARKRRRRSDGGMSRHGSNARRTTPSHGDGRAAGDLKRAARAAAIKSDLQRVIGPGAIELLSVKRLRRNPRNARRHSDRQIEQIAASICQFGFLNPIIIDETDRVLAGHGRLEAARQLSLKKIPCVRVDHLTPEAKRAYALADNRLAELSDWDEDLLAAELEELSALELDFDVEIVGFDTSDRDRLLGPEPDPRGRDGDTSGLSTDPDDKIPPVLKEPVSRQGDLWLLGAHRVLCGDALKPESYARVLQGETAIQVVSDPPYNVPVFRHVTSKAGFREFPMASGEMSREGFIEFLTKFLRHVSASTKDGAILHVFIDWRHIEEMLQSARMVGLSLMSVCIWSKPQPGMGSFYRRWSSFSS